jgi:hypothetical protein
MDKMDKKEMMPLYPEKGKGGKTGEAFSSV